MHDTTDMLSEYLDAWKAVNIELDAIYSGFLGSAEQVNIIKRLFREYPHALRIVDPVMGDAGKAYPTYTPELCAAMGELVDGADVLTPNLTEASILTGIDYEGQDVSEDYVKRILDALIGQGAKNVVLKGIVHGDGLIRNYVAGANTEFAEITSELLPYMLHGTGDLYASALLSAIMCNRSLYDAIEFAGTFVRDAMVITREQPDFEVRGVSFEGILSELTALV
jgi:pyridoxine kinase